MNTLDFIKLHNILAKPPTPVPQKNERALGPSMPTTLSSLYNKVILSVEPNQKESNTQSTATKVDKTNNFSEPLSSQNKIKYECVYEAKKVKSRPNSKSNFSTASTKPPTPHTPPDIIDAHAKEI